MAGIIITIFLLGYATIAVENLIRLNKAASALITGVLCWTAYILFSTDQEKVNEQLIAHLGDISGILFFLLGAMTIVELIDAHDGFQLISSRINTESKRKILWLVSLCAFFLSAVLDNLTTAIVMVSLLRKIVRQKEDRLLFSGMIIIAANAGGAWSPIGDVTTTMLWIGGQITSMRIVGFVFIPAMVCLIVPLILASLPIKGNIGNPGTGNNVEIDSRVNTYQKNIVLFCGIGILLLIPVFKSITHLPPYMGMLLGLGLMWLITEIIHSDKDIVDKELHSVGYALKKIDSSSILFFLGILLAISALESDGTLHQLANGLEKRVHSETMIVMIIGMLSSVIDNVPLVAASMGMYSLDKYPTDHFFWLFLSYCTGTGGSILIIGSAAGVAAMGIEKIEFFWYLKKISWLALIGFISGGVVFVLQKQFF